MKFKYIIPLIGLLFIVTSAVTGGVNPIDIEVQYNDVVKLDHLIYDENMHGVIESEYNIFVNVTTDCENWVLGLIGLKVGENNTYMGTEFGGCVHMIIVKGILRIEPEADVPVLVNPEIDEFLEGAGVFITDNWFAVGIAALICSYLGYKVIRT